MFSCDWVMRDNPGDKVIPYRCIAQPNAEGNCQVSYGTCPPTPPSASPTTPLPTISHSLSKSPLVSTSPSSSMTPSIQCLDSLDCFLVPGSGGNDMQTCDWVI